jgi:hypothetical protein
MLEIEAVTNMEMISQLRAEEKRILQKFNARAESLREDNPRLSIEQARSQAMVAMPNCSRKYSDVRSSLTQLRQRPMTFDEAEQ